MSSPPGTQIFRQTDNTVAIAAGGVIFSAGDEGDAMYVVIAGAIDLVVNGTTVETVQADGMFGELALIDREPRTATAVAKSDSTLVRVEPAQFMLMVRQTPFFATDVMRLLVYRLRQMDGRI